MKIRWPPFHKLRRRLFLLCLAVLAMCLLKLFYVRVTVGNSFYVEPYGVTVTSHRARYHEVNCTGIYQLDPSEVGKALEIRRKVIVDLEDDNIVSLTSDCDSFIQTRRYDQVPVTEEERRFPLAYSLVVHKNAPMVERILRVIYSPLNLYCLHYDQKASSAFIKAMENLAGCLPNVFIASRLEAVQYAHVSRLNADLNCLSDLLGSEVEWKYVINLCGQDFPLRSQAELGEELRALNGSNMLESSRPSEAKRQRFSFHHELRDVPYSYRRMPVKTPQPKAPPPHDIQVFIGSAYFVLSREFVSHVTRSAVVRDFLEWSADAYSPDEHFWATLVRLPGVPGRIPAEAPDVTDLQSKTRLVKWNYLEGSLYPACTGAHIRSVCIFGAAELRWLLNYGHWFANKFDSKVDPVLIKCLEEMLEERGGRRRSGGEVLAPSP